MTYRMKNMAISVFKSKALQVISEIAKSHEPVIITRHGKALAQVIPFLSPKNKAKAGRLSSMLIYEKNIVSPIGKGPWKAAR